jgi:hypothetical protein
MVAAIARASTNTAQFMRRATSLAEHDEAMWRAVTVRFDEPNQ